MNVEVVYHNENGWLIYVNARNHTQYDELPRTGRVKLSLTHTNAIQVEMGWAVVFYRGDWPMVNDPREGFWDVYTEETNRLLCLGEARRPPTWQGLVHLVRALWDTVQARDQDYVRNLPPYGVEVHSSDDTDSEGVSDSGDSEYTDSE
jgi:hypothetical protein